MSQLGIAYQRLNRLDEAIQIFEQSYEGYLKLNGEKDLSTIGVLRFLADCYAQRGELEQAEALLEKVVKVGKIGMGPDHLVTLTSMFRLAKVYNSRGKVEEALAVISHVATRRRAKSGAADGNTLVNEDLWSTVQMQTGQVFEAIKRWEDCYAVSVNELGPTDPTTVDICTHLAQAYTEVGTLDRATELLEMAIKKHPVSTGKSALGLIDLKLALSDVYSKVERFDEALGLGKDVVADFTAIVGPDHSATRAAMRSLGYIYLANKQFEIALPILLQSVELGCVANKSQLSFAGQQVSVGRMLLLAGEYASAEPLLVESVATLQRLKPDSWTTYSAQSMLGGVLAGLCRYEEAEPLLIGGYEGMEARQSKLLYAGTKRFREAAERIVKYYDSVGDSEKSELWQSKLMMLPSLE